MKRGTKLLAIAAGVGLIVYRDEITKMMAPAVLNLLVGGKALDQLTEELRQSGEKIYQTVGQKAGTAHNHGTFTHIIGIERWGQSRLKVALGEPLMMDEYDEYRPSKERPWADLRQDFMETRQETTELARRLADPAVDQMMVIPHNQLGKLSLQSWLHYLRFHADTTMKLMR